QALAGGVVVQGVDAAKGVEGKLHQRLDAVFIGDIDAAVGHFAVLGHLGGGVGQVEAGQVGDHHPGAAGGEALGGGKADAALGAADDDNLAFHVAQSILSHGIIP